MAAAARATASSRATESFLTDMVGHGTTRLLPGQRGERMRSVEDNAGRRARAGDLVGIKVLDHIVVGDGSFRSLTQTVAVFAHASSRASKTISVRIRQGSGRGDRIHFGT